MQAKTNDVTVEQVRELLSYDAETGDFHWTDSPKNRGKAGRKVVKATDEVYCENVLLISCLRTLMLHSHP